MGSRRATALPRNGEAARVPPAPGTVWGTPGPLYLRVTCGHPALAGLPSPLNAPTLCSWADSPLQLEPLTHPGFPQVSTPPSPGGGPQRRGWPPPSPPAGSGWCWLRSIGPLFTWPFTLLLLARGTQDALVARGCRPAGSLLFVPPNPTPSRGYQETDRCPPGGSRTSSPDGSSASLDRGYRIPSRTSFLSSAKLKTPPPDPAPARILQLQGGLSPDPSEDPCQPPTEAARSSCGTGDPSPLRQGSRDGPGLCAAEGH